MNKFMRFLWTIFSYCPLYITIDILLWVDYFTSQKISSNIILSWVFLGIVAISILGTISLVIYAKKHVSKTSFTIVSGASKDLELMTSMTTYLLPLLTLVFSEINKIALICFLVIIAIMLIITKAVFINPILCFSKYRYYSIQAESGVTYTLITKQKRFDPKKIKSLIEIFPEIYMEV